MRAVAEGIVAADNRRDLDAVLGFYAPDAILLPPGEDPVSGLGRIRRRYVALFEVFDPEIDRTVHEVVVRGDLAYVWGQNGGALRGRAGSDRMLNDAYLMVLLRLPRLGWRITRLIWHEAGAPDDAGTRTFEGHYRRGGPQACPGSWWKGGPTVSGTDEGRFHVVPSGDGAECSIFGGEGEEMVSVKLREGAGAWPRSSSKGSPGPSRVLQRTGRVPR